MEGPSDTLVAALIGFGGGAMLGLAGQMGRFCTLGAIEDALYGQDYRRLRMWSLAIGLSIIGAFALMEAGAFDPADTIYAAQVWNPLSSILGGLLFGYGMAIAGNCGFGALTRLGGGDLKSFLIVIVMGLAAHMTIGGPLGPLRVELFPPEAGSREAVDFGYAHAGAALTGLPAFAIALVIGGAFVALALADRSFRASPPHMVWSAVAAAAILSAWAALGPLAADSFDGIQVESHTYTAPIGETLMYLMTASAGGLNFSVGSVAGVLSGAVAGSLIKRRFRWEACDDPRELGRQMLGAALMGVGAVLALGCTIGQGLTAFSTLAYSAPVVMGCIFIGAAMGLRGLIQRPPNWWIGSGG